MNDRSGLPGHHPRCSHRIVEFVVAVEVRLRRQAASRAGYWSAWAVGADTGRGDDGSPADLEDRHSEQLHRIACLIELGRYEAALAEATRQPT